MDIVGNEGNHSGPINWQWMFLIVLVIMGVQPNDDHGGVQDIQLDSLIVRDIEQSLIVKEVAIL